MMDSTEKWGDDVDSAVELALTELELTRDQADVEVLEQPSRGFFGIGSKLAHVRVSRKKAPETAKPEEPEKEPEVTAPAEEVSSIPEAQEAQEDAAPEDAAENAQPEKEEAPAEERSAEAETEKEDSRPRYSKADRRRGKGDRRERRSRGRSGSDPAEYVSRLPELDFHREMDKLPLAEDHPAKKFLAEVTREMGVDLDITCRADDSNVLIDISGPDTRTVIGKRGQTLDAIQYLTSLVVNKDRKDYVRVVVDAENYRSRREKTLEQLADRLARKVVRTGHSVKLEPMNPYERKVIHSALQSNPDVTTRSEGQDPYRRVIIELK